MRPIPASRRWARATAAATLAAAAAGLAGCTAEPEPGPDDWILEPVAFDSSPEGGGDPIDVAFGMSVVAADGARGFWALSGASWLHIDDEGRTAARFTLADGDPLIRTEAMAAASPTEFAVIRNGPDPALSVLDITTMDTRDLRDPAMLDGSFGDWAFADVAVREGDAIVVRYVPQVVGYVDYEVVQVDLDDGSRTSLYRAPLSLEDSPASAPDFPPVDVDVDSSGAIHLATPTTRVTLAPDGTESHVEEWTADHPQVAVTPAGSALWWDGPGDSDAAAPFVVVGGSSEARAAIEHRESCSGPVRTDALIATDAGGAEHPLPFLCGANDATWTGGSWVVAIGGEGDGVLVRLTTPEGAAG